MKKPIWLLALAVCLGAAGMVRAASAPVFAGYPRLVPVTIGQTLFKAEAGICARGHQMGPQSSSNWHPGKPSSHKFRQGRSSEPTKGLADLPKPSDFHLGSVAPATSWPEASHYPAILQSDISPRAPPSLSILS